MKVHSPITNIEAAIKSLGATENSLEPHEKEAVDIQGYTILKNVFTLDRLTQLQESFDRSVDEQLHATVAQKETGTRAIADLHLKGFCSLCVEPKILAAAFYILKRRFVCMFPHGREPLEGFGQQGLHMDWLKPAQHGLYYVATAVCLLDDFTTDNGATRLVPGSHRNAMLPNKKIADPGFVHRDQVIINAPAGSVLMFNGNLLHSATRNRSSRRRRTVQFGFIAYEARTAIYTPEQRPPTEDPATLYVFGYED